MRMLELTLKRDGKRLLKRSIDENPITIGRAADNLIKLLDEEISRHHCRIEWREGTLTLTDLSTNGTFVNGKLRKETEISAGDIISVGQWSVQIETVVDAVPIKTVVTNARPTQVLKFDEQKKRLTTENIELVVQSPDQPAMRRHMPAREFIIGHHAACDIAVADPYVSRRHCKMINEDGRLALIDLASTNGTYVGNTKIDRMSIPPRGAFRIGRSTIHYRLERISEIIGPSKNTRLGNMIGHSKAMREVFALIERVAPSDASVCITGESGTGKELAARELHNRSPRRRGPFVAVNCGALPSSIIESQLFGHERGSFTGAVERAAGLIEQASGGTLFLDEIGEMPLELQTRLLRILEEKTVRRVGGKQELPVDLRLICATNRDLKRLVSEGRFRQDLFHRIFVVPLALPPLREHNEDIPALADHFIREISPQGRQPALTDGATQKLMTHTWPGNIRELKNTLERTILLSEGDVIDAKEIKIVPLEGHINEGGLRERERNILIATIDECNGNLSQASRKLGIARTTLQKKIKRYSIKVSRSIC